MEIRAVLKSLQEDLDNAASEEAKAEAVRSALVCLLDTLSDN
jgi:hypothetical protein